LGEVLPCCRASSTRAWITTIFGVQVNHAAMHPPGAWFKDGGVIHHRHPG
jgi:hypothetical protein